MKKMILIAAAFVTFAGCTKDTIAPSEPQTDIQVNASATGDTKGEVIPATIEWAGDPAADGLGWVLRTSDNNVEVPDNLTPEFAAEQLPVNVSFEKTDERVSCRCAEPKYYVHITFIERAKKGE